MNSFNTLDYTHKADAASGALFAAAQRGEVGRVTALLEAADTREITVQKEMHGALQIAIRNDFPGVVRVLCAAGAHFGLAVRKWNIMFTFPVRGFSITGRDFQPIHLAASVGSASCIAEFASHFQVNAGVRDGFLDTPLHWACRFAQVDAIRGLLAVRANAAVPNDANDTPLEVAVGYGHIRCVKVLVATRLEDCVLLQRARNRKRHTYDSGRAITSLLDRALRLRTQSAKTAE